MYSRITEFNLESGGEKNSTTNSEEFLLLIICLFFVCMLTGFQGEMKKNRVS